MQKDGTQLVKMHVSDGEGAIYLVSAVQLAMTSQGAHLSWQLYCTLCQVHAANELWTDVHKLQYLHVSLTEYIQGRRGSGCVQIAHISWSSCRKK